MSTPGELLIGEPINEIDNNYVKVVFDNIFRRTYGSVNTAPYFEPVGASGVPDGATNPGASIQYMRNKQRIIERAAQQRPEVILADKNLDLKCNLTNEISLEYEELAADSGTARYVLTMDNFAIDYIVNNTMIEEDLHVIIHPFPDRPDWRTRWCGKVHTLNVKRNADGTSEVELLAVSNREHAKRLLFGANPFFSPEVQLPRLWILPGPTRSVLFLSSFVNLARIFVPGLSFITNVFDPFAWLNPLNADSLYNVNPLSWPIQVAFVNPIADQSRWTVLGATWTTWHDASQDILKDAGCMLRAYTFLTTDEDSPHTELVELVDTLAEVSVNVFDELFDVAPGLAHDLVNDANKVLRPTRNCVVMSYEDRSGHTGPTGTALDGLLDVIGVTLDDLITSVLINAQTGLTLDGQPVYDMNGNEFPIAESILGVAPEPPRVIWREGQFSAQLESTHVLNKGSPRVVMTGGRSPSIVNQTQTFLIKWGLSQLQEIINPALGSASVGAVNSAFEMPNASGLQDLYQGQLDNVLFAWERVSNPLVSIWGGDLDWQEYLERGGGTAYTLASIITLQTALWKTRAYQGFKAQIQNGRPWVVGVDTTLGDRNGWEFDGVIYVDQIYGIRVTVDRRHPLITSLTVGDDKDKGDPLARTIRALQGVYSLFGAFLGEGVLFG